MLDLRLVKRAWLHSVLRARTLDREDPVRFKSSSCTQSLGEMLGGSYNYGLFWASKFNHSPPTTFFVGLTMVVKGQLWLLTMVVLFLMQC